MRVSKIYDVEDAHVEEAQEKEVGPHDVKFKVA